MFAQLALMSLLEFEKVLKVLYGVLLATGAEFVVAFAYDGLDCSRSDTFNTTRKSLVFK